EQDTPMSAGWPGDLVSRVLAESRLPGPGTVPPPVPPSLLGHRYAPEPAGPQGSAQQTPIADLDELLRHRRTVRSFSAQTPVPAATLSQVIAAAAGADAELWPAETAAGVDIELIVVAWRVAGLRPGVHAWDGTGFRWITGAPERSQPGSVALQRELQ